MRRFFLLLVVAFSLGHAFISSADYAPTGSGSVDDEAYGSSWNGVGDTAPSKNAVYNKIEALTVGAGATNLGDLSDVG